MTLRMSLMALMSALLLCGTGVEAQVVPGGMRIATMPAFGASRAVSVARLGRATGIFQRGIAAPLSVAHAGYRSKSSGRSADGMRHASWSSDTRGNSYAADLAALSHDRATPVVSVRLVPVYADMVVSFVNTAGPRAISSDLSDLGGVWRDITITVD